MDFPHLRQPGPEEHPADHPPAGLGPAAQAGRTPRTWGREARPERTQQFRQRRRRRHIRPRGRWRARSGEDTRRPSGAKEIRRRSLGPQLAAGARRSDPGRGSSHVASRRAQPLVLHGQGRFPRSRTPTARAGPDARCAAQPAFAGTGATCRCASRTGPPGAATHPVRRARLPRRTRPPSGPCTPTCPSPRSWARTATIRKDSVATLIVVTARGFLTPVRLLRGRR